ncbi:hypothetical protein PR001_g2759 [Phytophthora rubi]|uniref:DDE-1 domain-containing protein n=1 Tax=Phytophthora rubi TaxID=129364 RepID=A0A6A3NSA9_9STRA|nr:hypothetical protein PR002_g1033 [Phytophthora rubi]KAE9050041.1 hypothetical protein PR001_g2759 [Phytophthora rubi]
MVQVALTAAQKLQLIAHRQQCPWETNRQMATRCKKAFSLPAEPGKSTVHRIVGQKRQLEGMPEDYRHLKRMRPSYVVLLERHVLETLALFEGRAMLNYDTVVFLALLAAEELRIPAEKLPKFTNDGWCKHFLARHGYSGRRAHGEVDSVDLPAAMESVKPLRALVAKFDPADVFNVDEAAYFIKAISRVSVCLRAAPALKMNKTRVTILVGSNATGTVKLPLFVLGKSKNPRWLPEKPEEVAYKGTKEGWMNSDVFQDWLKELNEKMKAQNRNILLLYDNAPSHKEGDVELSNITTARLPKTTTALLQPMDQGIIAWLKRRVLKKRTAHTVLPVLLGEDNTQQMETIDAIEWISAAWNAMPEHVLRNCWRHTGLLTDRLLSVAHILN